MGLSKNDISIIEEIKITELTSAQKRRLRRKKLKAARGGSLESDNDTQKDSVDTNKPSCERGADLVHGKKKKSKCSTQACLVKSQNITCEAPISSDNQKSNTENLIIPSENLKPLTQHPIESNNKPTPKHIEDKEVAVDVPRLKNKKKNNIPQCKIAKAEEKEATSEANDPSCKNLGLSKKKSNVLTPDGCQQSNTNNSSVSEKKKNKCDTSVLVENQADFNRDLKQGILSPRPSKEIKNKISKEVLNIENEKVNGKNHILIDKLTPDKLLAIVCHSANKVDNCNTEIQKPLNQNTVPIEKEVPSSGIQDMGKSQDNTASKKEQQTLVKQEPKQEDPVSTAPIDSANSREEVKAAREAKKLAKQKAKKKNETTVEDAKPAPVKDVSAKPNKDKISNNTKEARPVQVAKDSKHKENIPPVDKGSVARKEHREPAEKSNSSVKGERTIEMSEVKDEEGVKSKAELRAERRAKQEAQRAAKLAAPAPQPADNEPAKNKEEKSPKPKSTEKPKAKVQSVQQVGWLQHLVVDSDRGYLKNIPINSNVHPAIVKLGVQLEARVVRGANARCVALLDAIKKMVRDYSLPARTEAARGLQAQLAAAERYLAARRAPAAPDRNALKHLRRALTQLPPHVSEYDAKEALQEEIERYVREQIDMAGEAISLFLRTKISPGDHVLTYGCSSLVERALGGAWAAGVRFRATVAGARGQRGAEMQRRLRARGLPARYVDLAALSHLMDDVQKVVLGAGALLAHGAALGAAGSAATALLARARNVPVLVACETHKFSEQTALDPLAAHPLGDPDELIDWSDESSPLRDWRSNPRLTLLNVTHDLTPPNLISAVVTELGVLPCTSAPVVLRLKQAEYGM